MGSLIDGGIKWSFKMWWSKLTPAAGTLTGGRSLISKAETEVESPRLWAVCSITISQYLNMRWAKLNAHTDAGGNLCACTGSCFTSRNGWYEIGGACYEGRCRCRCCWPRPMFWTQRWFVGLENFLIKALHIAYDQGQRERSLDYLSGECQTWTLAKHNRNFPYSQNPSGIFHIIRENVPVGWNWSKYNCEWCLWSRSGLRVST